MSMCQLPWDCFNAVATCVATSVGIVLVISGFIGGIYEYMKRCSQKRAELLDRMRGKFMGRYDFRDFCYELDRLLSNNTNPGENNNKDNKKVDNIIYHHWWDFINFFEEIALMVNSKLMNENVAYEMFGYYAVRFLELYDNYSNRNGGRFPQTTLTPSIGLLTMDDLEKFRPLFYSFLKNMKNIKNKIEEKKKEGNYKFKSSDYRL